MRRLLLSAAVLLAACESKPSSNEANAGANAPESAGAVNETASANAAAVPNAVSNGAEGGEESGALPPGNAALRFVGTWAANKAECATKPWRFTANALVAKGGPNCSFYKVTKAPGGYDIAAQCPTKEPVHTDLINVRFAESAGAMLVESNAIKPMGLVYCGK